MTTDIPQTDWVYDIETYLDLFCIDLTHIATRTRYIYEISDRCNDTHALAAHLRRLGQAGHRMFGYNNVGFDYPVLHYLLGLPMGEWSPWLAHARGTDIIMSRDRFANTVWPNERVIIQGDLFLIHHFDNPARSTSLKKLEINMRSGMVVDLPYPPDEPTTNEQKDEIIAYMAHDVSETLRFYHASRGQIAFRDDLAQRYPDLGDVLNFNDTKIGKVFFEKELERNGTPCREWVSGRKRPRQTLRDTLPLRDVISPSVRFQHPEFNRIKSWLEAQTLRRGGKDNLIETKGIFSDVSCHIDGFGYHFGTGGIHGSVESTRIHEDDEWEIWDWDVASYYPNIAISNRFFPAHLSESFCDVYQQVYEMRQQHAKGTPENAMLKLALNGVYGDSNNKWSVFYDPAYTMSITINGQLLLCMLAEWLTMGRDDMEMIQINTDGLTVRVRKGAIPHMQQVCADWEKHTGLTLESVRYKSMFIRDVNSYIAVKHDGGVKRIGAYKQQLGWHQDQSAMVVIKAAEKQMLDGVPVAETIKAHRDSFDFQASVKVPRSSKLLHGDVQVQNTSRFYYSTTGGAQLTKVMPPLKGSNQERRISVGAGWDVTLTNDMRHFDWNTVNWRYYITEAEKLVI